MLELQEVIENVMALPLDKKAYLAEILIKDINTRKTEPTKISVKTDFRRIYRKNRNER